VLQRGGSPDRRVAHDYNVGLRIQDERQAEIDRAFSHVFAPLDRRIRLFLPFLMASIDPIWGRRSAPRAADAPLTWNWLGLLALANVVVRSALTAPGPLHLLHTTLPNRAIGTFPYTYIPGLCVPLAVSLHVLSIRFLRAQLSFTHQRAFSAGGRLSQVSPFNILGRRMP